MSQPFGTDHFQVQRTGVAVFVQNADVTDEVDVAAPVGLIFGRARTLLATLAVTDMHVFDAVR